MARLSRRQIDRLGERLRVSPSDEDLLAFEEYRKLFIPVLERAVQTLRNMGFGSATSDRIKRVESVIAKLQRQPTLKLSQMQDVAGCRLVVNGVAEQEAFRQRLQAQFPDCKVYDRRVNPNSGYRAVHVVVRLCEPPRMVEIQIRTKNQQLWAHLSELAAQNDMSIKYGGGGAELRGTLDQLSETLWEKDLAGEVAMSGADDDTMGLRPYRSDSEVRRLIDVVLARIRPPRQ